MLNSTPADRDQITFTCPNHGTISGELQVIDYSPVLERECCEDAFGAQLKWDCFIEEARNCQAQSVHNATLYESGDWIGPYESHDGLALLRWAAREIADQDEEFNYGFNVLYYQEKEREAAFG